MTKGQENALANANAHLNDAGFPSYNEVLDALSYLLRQANLSDLPENNNAILIAQKTLRRAGRQA